MSLQNLKLLSANMSVREPDPEWMSWSPDNKPPFNWEDPTIRFWRDVLKRPLPPTNHDEHMLVKWEPLIRGMDSSRSRAKAAVLLEYQARLLRSMTGYDGDMMDRFGRYCKEHEQAWFRVGPFEPEFEESLKKPPEEPSGVGMFMKFLFPIIRWRCNKDDLTDFAEKVFED